VVFWAVRADNVDDLDGARVWLFCTREGAEWVERGVSDEDAMHDGGGGRLGEDDEMG
jgi:hypothetical protein